MHKYKNGFTSMLRDECIAEEQIRYGVIIPSGSKWILCEYPGEEHPRFESPESGNRWYIPVDKLTFLKRGEPKKMRVIRD